MEPNIEPTLPYDLPNESSLDEMMEALLDEGEITSASADAKCPKCQNAQRF